MHRLLTRALATASGCALIALPLVTAAPAVGAEPDGPAIELGLNDIYQEATSLGGSCSFFSAGKSHDFTAQLGDVEIVKGTADGGRQRATRANICTPVTAGSIEQRAVFSDGAGHLDPATGEGTLRWSGSFTANAYGGGVPWWIEDPELTVSADGAGDLTATVGGRGASMANPTDTHDIAPRRVTLARFAEVNLRDGRLVATPDFAGVDYFPLAQAGDRESGRAPDSAIPAAAKRAPGWGSWPESLVDFHYESGLSSYWHTSGSMSDEKKRPLPIVVTLGERAAVGTQPVITANPSTTTPSPFLEGDDVTFTAAAEDADSLRWESAESADGPWTAIPGATGDTLTIPAIEKSWNGRLVRLVAENAAGSTASSAAPIRTVTPADLRILAQPRALAGIAGSRAEIVLRADGTPRPEGLTVERRASAGGAWEELPGTEVTSTGDEFRVLLPAADQALSGEQLRVVVRNSRGAAVSSEPIAYSVVPATGKPQVVVSPSEPIDPDGPVTLTVVGAGFAVPAPDALGSSSIAIGVFYDEDWQPGEEGYQGWIATSPDSEWGQLDYATLTASGGAFTATIELKAGALAADSNHGVATFIKKQSLGWDTSFEERGADTFTRIPLLAPEEDPAPLGPVKLDDESSGAVSAALAGVALELTLPREYPGTNVFLSTGDGQPLGWHRVDGEHRVSAQLPATPQAGPALVTAQSVDGELRGWATYDAPAPTPAPTPEPDPEATPDPEPTAIPDPEPTAVVDPEPTAAPDPEPAAVPDPEPAAGPAPLPSPAPAPAAAPKRELSDAPAPAGDDPAKLATTGGSGLESAFGAAGAAAAALGAAGIVLAARSRRRSEERASAASD
ncbi:hypothetical protein [Leucobacter luti]|uniref:hypothetical protein n=1 Tax=Leucobacter luti TaxID=340320 RepID=UPI003CFC0440